MLLIYLEMGIINQMTFSSYIFHLNKDVFSYEKKSVQEFYEIFEKLLKKKSVIESMFIHVAGLSSYQDIFLGIFFEFSEHFIRRATVNDYL